MPVPHRDSQRAADHCGVVLRNQAGAGLIRKPWTLRGAHGGAVSRGEQVMQSLSGLYSFNPSMALCPYVSNVR